LLDEPMGMSVYDLAPVLIERQVFRLLAAVLVGLILLVGAIVLQTAYHALLLLGIWVGLPSLFVAKAVGRRAMAGAKRARRLTGAHSDSSRQGVGFTFDELALIYKSLQAARTLALHSRTSSSRTHLRSSIEG
jgi:hypothetical protein